MSARARVSHGGHEYSMPPAAIGQAATLHLYEDRVEILTKTGLVIRHPRSAAPASRLPEHRAAMFDTVRGARGRLYFQRQSVWELGRPAEAWLTELIHRRPARWRPDVGGLLHAAEDYGAAPLLDAFDRGVRRVRVPAAGAHARGGRRITDTPPWPSMDCSAALSAPTSSPRASPLIFSGPSGTGKTHLAIAIAYRAIQNGFHALFTTATALIEDLSAGTREGKLRPVLPTCTHSAVLVIDEVGYLGYGPDAANVLFQVVDDRYLHQRPMILTTNKPLAAWGQVLHDADLAEPSSTACSNAAATSNCAGAPTGAPRAP